MRFVGPVCFACVLALAPSVRSDEPSDIAGLAELVRNRQDALALAQLSEQEARAGLEPRLQYLRARLLERSGKRCEAAQAWSFSERRLPTEVREDVKERRTAAARACQPATTQQSVPSPQIDEAELTPQQRLRRARLRLEKRRFETAFNVLQPMPKGLPRTQRAEWLYLSGMALFNMRSDYLAAAKLLARASKLPGSHAADAAFHAARALSRADRDNAAIRDYRRFVRRYPRHKRAAEAEYLAAWLQWRKQRKAGEQAFERFLKGRRGKRAKWREQALWHLSLSAIETRRWSRARRYLERYLAESLSWMEKAQALYWLGRVAQRRGKRADASTYYLDVLSHAPLSWYGGWAALRLEKLGVKPPDLTLDAAVSAGASDLEVEPGELPAFYASLGLTQDSLRAARKERRSWLRQFPKERRLEALTRLYQQLGATDAAYGLVRGQVKVPREGVTSANLWWWRAAYPQPFQSLVVAAATEFEVPVALVYAVMRQESGYRLDAESRAGALGLLQLMPHAARRLAEPLGLDLPAQNLIQPQPNIRLGVAHLAEALDAHRGDLVLMLSSYNAGTAQARRWQRRIPHRERDLFVERIPFNETRNYVRRVTGHMLAYRFLGSSEAVAPGGPGGEGPWWAPLKGPIRREKRAVGP